MSSATGTPELEEFVEAPAAFTPERPGTRIIRSDLFTLLADATGRWPLAVQGIRLHPDELDDAVEAARSLMRDTGTTAASWWLSEHSTPADIEAELLGRGMQIVEDDYLVDGMALTREPPPGPSWACGRGAYRALVRARWDDAVARGTPALAVQAGTMSAPILRGLGFEQVCLFRRIHDVALQA